MIGSLFRFVLEIGHVHPGNIALEGLSSLPCVDTSSSQHCEDSRHCLSPASTNFLSCKHRSALSWRTAGSPLQTPGALCPCEATSSVPGDPPSLKSELCLWGQRGQQSPSGALLPILQMEPGLGATAELTLSLSLPWGYSAARCLLSNA